MKSKVGLFVMLIPFSCLGIDSDNDISPERFQMEHPYTTMPPSPGPNVFYDPESHTHERELPLPLKNYVDWKFKRLSKKIKKEFKMRDFVNIGFSVLIGINFTILSYSVWNSK